MQPIKRDYPAFIYRDKQKRNALHVASMGIMGKVERANSALPSKYGKRKFVCLKDPIDEDVSLGAEILKNLGVCFFHNWYLCIPGSIASPDGSFFKKLSKSEEGEQFVSYAFARCWRELDWSKSRYNNPYETDGLLTADGEWIGCGYGSHYETESALLGGEGYIFEGFEKIIHFSEGALPVDFQLTEPQIRWLENAEKRIEALSEKIKDPVLKSRFLVGGEQLAQSCRILLKIDRKRFYAPTVSRMPRIDTSNFETGLRKLPRSGD